MKVYRIEDKDNRGPYGSFQFECDWTETYHCAENGRPGPFNDSVITGENLLFGFDSLWGLRRWFTPQERNTLRKHGFNISSYEIEEKYVNYSETRRQLTFDISKITHQISPKLREQI